MKETVVEPPQDKSEFTCLGDVAFEGRTSARAKRAPSATGQPGPTKVAAQTPANVQTVYIDKATGLPTRNVVTPENDAKKRLFDGTFSLRDGLKIEPPKT